MGRNEEEWKRAKDTEDDNTMARILRETLQKGINEGLPKTKTTWKSKAWFNQEVKEKRREMGAARRWKQGRR